jgi:hypothetical protein
MARQGKAGKARRGQERKDKVRQSNARGGVDRQVKTRRG